MQCPLALTDTPARPPAHGRMPWAGARVSQLRRRMHNVRMRRQLAKMVGGMNSKITKKLKKGTLPESGCLQNIFMFLQG